MVGVPGPPFLIPHGLVSPPPPFLSIHTHRQHPPKSPDHHFDTQTWQFCSPCLQYQPYLNPAKLLKFLSLLLCPANVRAHSLIPNHQVLILSFLFWNLSFALVFVSHVSFYYFAYFLILSFRPSPFVILPFPHFLIPPQPPRQWPRPFMSCFYVHWCHFVRVWVRLPDPVLSPPHGLSGGSGGPRGQPHAPVFPLLLGVLSQSLSEDRSCMVGPVLILLSAFFSSWWLS